MSEKPRIVVAGGTGMIGRRLCPHLVAAGYEVVVLTRGDSRTDAHGVRHLNWDPAGGDDWHGEIDGALAVVNLCGETIAGPRWTERRKQQLISSRTVPSSALAQAVARAAAPPMVFLQASGVGYYGIAEDTRTEESPAGEDFLARLAAEWEAPLHTLDIRYVAMRFGVVLDANDGALPQMLLPFRLFVGGPIAGGRQWFSWVHINDAVRAIHHLLGDAELVGAINVVAPGAVRNRELATTIGAVLERPAFFPVPRFMMTLLLGEQATLVCDGQKVKPARLTAAGFEFEYANIESALRDLNST